MKITVWHNCVVVAELDVPDAPGPDLKVDPYNDLIGVEYEAGQQAHAQTPVSYRNGLQSREAVQ